MVAERAFVACLCVAARRQAQRFARVNVAFDDKVGVGQNAFQFGQNVFNSRPSECGKRNVGRRDHVLRSLDGDALAENGAEDFHFRIA